ncbi:hypothetical protein AXG93_1855s1050 [Marchantia polymorpha subsp. ruderalis]|uniref:Uncharacterized protein n=1 Tax=Marchantia polymorpha subsp. ruderalis TaxID=1480154 RepID=A0A176VLL9_MARPO|nr:hypothetical protein AXG93_1855s1050 [Marchantia polymorpha subsp. ruderalis]
MRRIDETAVQEERLQRTALIAMRTPDFRALSKMKARRLVLTDDSSPESRRTLRKDCPSQEARSVEKAACNLRADSHSDRSTIVEKSQASRRKKGTYILTEDVPLKRRDVLEEKTRREEPRDQAAEVLTVSSETKQDLLALKEVAAKAVEDVAAAESEPQKVLPLLQYLDRKRKKYAEGNPSESYVEIVRNRTRIKQELAVEVAAKERRSQPTEAKYHALQRKLTKEVEKRRKVEQASDSLPKYVERAKCACVDLLKRLEACRTAYDAEALKVDELQTDAEEAKREYQTALEVKAKKLFEYKAARIADLELIEKLETQCGELRTQRSQAKEQLCEVEAKLTEAEGKNRQLSEETREGLTVQVERCFRGYALWQIKSHNGLQLLKIEHRGAELIKKSRRRHHQQSKKLESYLTTSRDAVAKLEVE